MSTLISEIPIVENLKDKITLKGNALESEAIYIMREVAAQFEKPVLLFSGGKDSITVAHIARKAFFPGKVPFPLVHIDTGHNFPETISFRDKYVEELGAELIIGSVQKSIDEGKVVEEKGYTALGLGKRILRAETASVVSLALLQSRFGDI